MPAAWRDLLVGGARGASEFAPHRRLDLEGEALLDDDHDILGGADFDDRTSLTGQIEVEVRELVRGLGEAARDA
jgi:hypothetical protein